MKKWYAVIGDPIAHSLSPFMHEIWFQENDIDASFLPIHVEPSKLKQACEALHLLGASGFNVTVPHKQAIIPLLDGIDDTAAKMNAVNTVVRNGKKFKGSNTDGDGFVQSLRTANPKVDSRILLVGAGGAARGISFALNRAGFKDVTITNRTFRRAEELAAETGSKAVTKAEAEQILNGFDIIIQTTSVGLAEDEALPISLEKVREGTLAADIVYNPIDTPFLKKAEEKGCKTLNGVGMFVYQGAISFEKWTGIKPDTEKMIQVITEKLGGNYVNR
ncbi:shikimate dehydrogenase [Planococcus halotolerans]|uniref:Shikimate dehydrogenase (NADP(+)) n=1 Tax=Planococcus halotolerans TaxID=2233542 RepID=A0A365KTW0_9BACL|nr:shikimate dehydrogenase [Planococcus halotolerans]QHJ71531.1 shikimate dehydrogenase [Planococcus halotolerans]RAZ76614.1 shikimate dehydrogenase [Planococcus halotolerans]